MMDITSCMYMIVRFLTRQTKVGFFNNNVFHKNYKKKTNFPYPQSCSTRLSPTRLVYRAQEMSFEKIFNYTSFQRHQSHFYAFWQIFSVWVLQFRQLWSNNHNDLDYNQDVKLYGTGSRVFHSKKKRRKKKQNSKNITPDNGVVFFLKIAD